jgi:hypothetical protein
MDLLKRVTIIQKNEKAGIKIKMIIPAKSRFYLIGNIKVVKQLYKRFAEKLNQAILKKTD